MNRRDALTSLSMAGGASLLASADAARRRSVPAPVHAGFAQAVARNRAGQDPRHQDHPHRAQSHPPGRRQGRDDRAGARRLGLRDVHAARARRRDGDREVPQAVPHRAQRRRDRGHLAVELHELVLAERPGALQRDERRRHRALGHQGQARRDAALSAARRQGAARRRLLLPRERRQLHGSRRERARGGMERGFRHVRVQVSTPGYASYGARSTAAGRDRRGQDDVVGPDQSAGRSGSRRRTCGCCRSSSSTCATKLGDEVELLHDVHERVTLNQGINLCKALEPYRLFFLEDPFPPEDNDHFRLLRQQTSIPIAMGELFNTQHEYLPLIKDRLIDFIRIHISQIGGLSPARKVRRSARVLRRPHRVARAGRRVAARARRAARAGARELQLRRARRRRLPEGDAGGVRRLSRGQERLHARAGEAGPRDRLRREARREIPDSRRPAELRLLVGHDAAEGWDGDKALSSVVRSSGRPVGLCRQSHLHAYFFHVEPA